MSAMPMRTILVTTDFSPTSKRALPLAGQLAETFGARLVLAYVEEDRLPPLILEYTDVGLEDIVQRQQLRAEGELRELAEKEFPGLDVKRVMASGVPHLEIVELARRLDADLIVMSTHGRGFFSHAILGSTTERVVRRAPCPVLVVRDAEGA